MVIGLPNHLHLEAVTAAARAGKGILCTKPLARTAAEAKEILDAVEKAGVFHGYLEDLVYTPKTLQGPRVRPQGRDRPRAVDPLARGAPRAAQRLVLDEGALGRRRHRGPGLPLASRSAAASWARTCARSRSSAGARRRCTRSRPRTPRSASCATRAAPSRSSRWRGRFRGGMDLRDEVSGTDGTIWINHWLRTGFEMFSAPGSGGYVAEKAETESGWLFPVGDEVSALGYDAMFADMLDAFDQKRAPVETFYDGYVVNAIMDACYRSIETKRWEPVVLDDWRGSDGGAGARASTSSTTRGTGSSSSSGCRTGGRSSS